MWVNVKPHKRQNQGQGGHVPTTPQELEFCHTNFNPTKPLSPPDLSRFLYLLYEGNLACVIPTTINMYECPVYAIPSI